MISARLGAIVTPASFAALVAVLAAAGAVSPVEAFWAAASVLAAFLPSGWLSPGGWRRRAVELTLLPAAFALAMAAEETMRQATVPPLLVLAATAAAVAAGRGAGPRGRIALAACLALAVRAAGGLGLADESVPVIVAALAAPAVAAAAAARWSRGGVDLVVALAAGSLPMQREPLAALLAVAVAVALLHLLGASAAVQRIGRFCLPAVLAAAAVGSTVAPWGGLSPGQAFPASGLLAATVGAAVVLASPLLPAAVAGPVWLAATLALGGSQPPPPDRAAVSLTATSPSSQLSEATGGTYVADLALTNAAALPAGTRVATITLPGWELPVRAGIQAVEWAHEREDVLPSAAHPLPASPIRRPSGLGRQAFWASTGRISGVVAAGAAPVITRAPGLPEGVDVVVVSAGPSRPTPPRDWDLQRWLLAATLVVAVLQLASGTGRSSGAWFPWTILIAGSLLARLAVEPHRLLAERHAVDLALAALLAAWLPVARSFLRRGKIFLTAAALLVPLAVATVHLSKPMGDEPYHLLLVESLKQDLDFDLENNYDLDRHPENLAYKAPAGWFIQPPTLAVLLLPGYAAAGRTGALVMLALAGAGIVALVARRARGLGVPASRVGTLAILMLASYPLVTFSSQVWPEVPAALAAALGLTLLAAGAGGPLLVSAVAIVPIWLKTRLALALFPLALAAWWPQRRGRAVLGRVALAAVAAALLALSFSWLVFGDPLDTLGRRRLADLVPASLAQAVTTLGGLAFDAGSGVAFAAPLLVVALAGVPALWRRGGKGERALLVGAALTVAGLLSNVEWRGGDSPPARYLVVLLPVLALAGAMLLLRPWPGRRLAIVLVPPTLLVSWVFVTRPHLAVNTGTGGTWLADALATRFTAAAWELFPSFLRASAVRWWLPLTLVAVALAAALAARQRPRLARLAAAASPALWLLAAAALVATLSLRPDRRIEMESPHVVRHGGILWPPAGQMSRFRFANGWTVGVGEAVEVPVRVAPGATYAVEGYLLEKAVEGAALQAGWDAEPGQRLAVTGAAPGSLPLPPPPGPGHRTLRLAYDGPAGGFAMLDAVVRTH